MHKPFLDTLLYIVQEMVQKWKITAPFSEKEVHKLHQKLTDNQCWIISVGIGIISTALLKLSHSFGALMLSVSLLLNARLTRSKTVHAWLILLIFRLKQSYLSPHFLSVSRFCQSSSNRLSGDAGQINYMPCRSVCVYVCRIQINIMSNINEPFVNDGGRFEVVFTASGPSRYRLQLSISGMSLRCLSLPAALWLPRWFVGWPEQWSSMWVRGRGGGARR
jgi:hypothetical protein